MYIYSLFMNIPVVLLYISFIMQIFIQLFCMRLHWLINRH